MAGSAVLTKPQQRWPRRQTAQWNNGDERQSGATSWKIFLEAAKLTGRQEMEAVTVNPMTRLPGLVKGGSSWRTHKRCQTKTPIKSGLKQWGGEGTAMGGHRRTHAVWHRGMPDGA